MTSAGYTHCRVQTGPSPIELSYDPFLFASSNSRVHTEGDKSCIRCCENTTTTRMTDSVPIRFSLPISSNRNSHPTWNPGSTGGRVVEDEIFEPRTTRSFSVQHASENIGEADNIDLHSTPKTFETDFLSSSSSNSCSSSDSSDESPPIVDEITIPTTFPAHKSAKRKEETKNRKNIKPINNNNTSSCSDTVGFTDDVGSTNDPIHKPPFQRSINTSSSTVKSFTSDKSKDKKHSAKQNDSRSSEKKKQHRKSMGNCRVM